MHKNEKGVTLIEVLAVLIIVTIVSLLVFSIMNSSSKQQKEQAREVKQIQDGAYILKQITKDLRKSYEVDLTTPDIYIFSGNQENEFTYKFVVNELYRYDSLNGYESLLASNIEDFLITGDEEVAIQFRINDKTYKTTINLRKGSK